jgi:signal transduction histidine kinase
MQSSRHKSPNFLKSIFRSLRFRLTVWNTAVVLLTVVGTLIGVREGLRITIRHEVDDLLREDAAEVELAVRELYPNEAAIRDEMKRKATGHAQRGMFVELLEGPNRVVWSSPTTPSEQEFRTRLSDGNILIGDQLYRVVERTLDLDKAGVHEFTIRVGSSMAGPDQDIATLTRTMTAVGLLIMFIAPLGGFWLAGRATRPLGQIIRAAERLRPRKMEERLPIRGAGDELDQLSLTINRFLDLIADYLDRNREFVANAAHELRSPLAAIQSSVEVALNSDRTIDAYKDLLSEIVNECSSLGSLVNQLLLLAETDAGNLQLSDTVLGLDRLSQHSVDMFRGAAEERGVELRFGRKEPVFVRGDAQRLQQVVNNLIDNAVKFTPSAGHVVVDLYNDHERNVGLFRVRDTGIGIAPADLPHVVERFYRGDKSRHREHQPGGTGLGLSICQSIIQMHGGHLEIESNLGNGTDVLVTFPLATDDTTTEAPSPSLTTSPY